MIVASRIVLALLAALGAISAGIALEIEDRFHSASYSYTAFGIVVVLAFVVGWAVGGIAGKLLQRGFRRVERAAQSRSAGELTVGAFASWSGFSYPRCSISRCTPCRTSAPG